MSRWWVFRVRRRAARIRRLRERVRHSQAMATAFIAGREPETAADFIAACSGCSEHGRWLLAVRWAVARVSRVRPEWIRAADRLADVTKLPGWSGDCAGHVPATFVLLIEMAAGVSLPDTEWERVPCPELHGSLRVGEFAAAVAAACERVPRAGAPRGNGLIDMRLSGDRSGPSPERL